MFKNLKNPFKKAAKSNAEDLENNGVQEAKGEEKETVDQNEDQTATDTPNKLGEKVEKKVDEPNTQHQDPSEAQSKTPSVQSQPTILERDLPKNEGVEVEQLISSEIEEHKTDENAGSEAEIVPSNDAPISALSTEQEEVDDGETCRKESGIETKDVPQKDQGEPSKAVDSDTDGQTYKLSPPKTGQTTKKKGLLNGFRIGAKKLDKEVEKQGTGLFGGFGIMNKKEGPAQDEEAKDKKKGILGNLLGLRPTTKEAKTTEENSKEDESSKGETVQAEIRNIDLENMKEQTIVALENKLSESVSTESLSQSRRQVLICDRPEVQGAEPNLLKITVTVLEGANLLVNLLPDKVALELGRSQARSAREQLFEFFLAAEDLKLAWLHFGVLDEQTGDIGQASASIHDMFFKRTVGKRITGWLGFNGQNGEKSTNAKATREQGLKLVNDKRAVVAQPRVRVELESLFATNLQIEGTWKLNVTTGMVFGYDQTIDVRLRAAIGSEVHTTASGVCVDIPGEGVHVTWNEEFVFHNRSIKPSTESLNLSILFPDSPDYERIYSLIEGTHQYSFKSVLCADSEAACSVEIATEFVPDIKQKKIKDDPLGFKGKYLVRVKQFRLRSVPGDIFSKAGASVHLKLGNCSECITSGVLLNGKQVPSRMRRLPGDVDYTELRPGNMIFSSENIELEHIQILLYGKGSSQIEQIAQSTLLPLATCLNMWQPLLGPKGELRGEIFFEFELKPFNEIVKRTIGIDNQLCSLVLTFDQLHGIQNSSLLGPAEMFLETSVLELENNAIPVWSSRTLPFKEPYEFRESMFLPIGFLEAAFKMQALLVKVQVKTIREVILGELSVDVSELVTKLKQTALAGKTVPLRFHLKKGFVRLSAKLTLDSDMWGDFVDTGDSMEAEKEERLSLSVHGCRNLRIGGKREPKIVIQSLKDPNASITTTEKPKGGNANPSWNETLVFGNRGTELLLVTALSGNQILGSTIILATHLLGETESKWYPLMFKGMSAGDIKLGLETLTMKNETEEKTVNNDQEAPVEHEHRTIFVRIKHGDLRECAQNLDVAIKLKYQNQWHLTQFRDIDKFASMWNQRMGPYHIYPNDLDLSFSVVTETLFRGQNDFIAKGSIRLDWEMIKSTQSLKVVIPEFPNSYIEIDIEPQASNRGRRSALNHSVIGTSSFIKQNMELWNMNILGFNDIGLPFEMQELKLKLENGTCCSFRQTGPDQFVGAMTTCKDEFNTIEGITTKYFVTLSDELLCETSKLYPQNKDKESKTFSGLDAGEFQVEDHSLLRMVHLAPVPYPIQWSKENVLQVKVIRGEGFTQPGEYSLTTVLMYISGSERDEFARTRLVRTESSRLYWGETFEFKNKVQGDPPVAIGVEVSAYDKAQSRFLKLKRTIPIDLAVSKQENCWFDLTEGQRVQLKVLVKEQAPEDSEETEGEHVDPTESRYLEAFAKYDVEGDGKIPTDLAKQLVQEQLLYILPNVSADVLANEIRALDKNGDHVVTKEEFLVWVRDKQNFKIVPSGSGGRLFQVELKKAVINRAKPARVFFKLSTGEKHVTEPADGPEMIWPKSPMFRFPGDSVTISVVENQSGKRIAWLDEVPLDELADTKDEVLQGLPLRVRVDIFKGENLRAADNNGKGVLASMFNQGKKPSSDPYCIVTVAGQVKTTQVQNDTTNPEWNETLFFDLNPEKVILDADGLCPVSIVVKDKDNLSFRDDFLGSCEATCAETMVEQTVDLTGKNACGTITISTQVEAFEEAKLDWECKWFTPEELEQSEVTVDGMNRHIVQRAKDIDATIEWNNEISKLLTQTHMLHQTILIAPPSRTETSLALQVHQLTQRLLILEERTQALANDSTKHLRGIGLEVYRDGNCLYEDIQHVCGEFIKVQGDTLYSKVHFPDVLDPLVLDHLLALAIRTHTILKNFESRRITDRQTLGDYHISDAGTSLERIKDSDAFVRKQNLLLIKEYTGIDLEQLQDRVAQDSLGELEECNVKDQILFSIFRPFLQKHDLEGHVISQTELDKLKARVGRLQQQQDELLQVTMRAKSELIERQEDLREAIVKSNNEDLLASITAGRQKLSISQRSHCIYAKHIASVSSRTKLSHTMSAMVNAEIQQSHENSKNLNAIRARGKALYQNLCCVDKKLAELAKTCSEQTTNLTLLSQQQFQPVSDMDLTVLNLYGAIDKGYIDAFQVLQRYLFVGGTHEGISDDSVLQAVLKRVQHDSRKLILETALVERLDKFGETVLQVRKTSMFRRFVMEENNVDSTTDIKESARRVAASIVKKEYLSFEKVKDLGGILQVRILKHRFASSSDIEFQGQLEALIGGVVVATKENTTLPCEFNISMDKLTAKQEKIELRLIPTQPSIDGNIYQQSVSIDTNEFVKKACTICEGWFPSRPEALAKLHQGFIEARTINMSKSAEATYNYVCLRVKVEGFEVAKAVWCLTNKTNQVKKLFYPGWNPGNNQKVPSLSLGAYLDRELVQNAGPEIPVKIEFGADGLATFELDDEALPIKLALSYTADQNAASTLRCENAASRIAASYRGHKVRKNQLKMGDVILTVHGDDLLNSLGTRSQTMSSRLRVYLGDSEIGTSGICRRGGSTPTWEAEMSLPKFHAADVIRFVLVEAEMEDLSISPEIGTLTVPKDEFVSNIVGASDPKWATIRGGLRAACVSELDIHVVRVRLGKFTQGNKYSAKVTIREIRSRGNKQSTKERSCPASGVIDWSEGFFFKGGSVSVHDIIEIRLFEDQELVDTFELSLVETLGSTCLRTTTWLKTSSNALLVKCSVPRVSERKEGGGKIKIHARWKESSVEPSEDTANVVKSDRPRCLDSGQVQLKVIEATGLASTAIRPKVFATLLPWGTSCPTSRGRTNRVWSDGKHAKWTKFEHNDLELFYPGCSEKEVTDVKLMVEIMVDHETIVGQCSIPLAGYINNTVDTTQEIDWYALQGTDQGKIRLKLALSSNTGNDSVTGSVEKTWLAVCFHPNRANNAATDHELDREAGEGAPLPRTQILSDAIESGNVGPVTELIGLDKNLASSDIFINDVLSTPLHLAVQRNLVSIVKLLLENGADMDCLDGNGHPASYYAHNLKMLQTLGKITEHTVLVSKETQLSGMTNLMEKLKNELQRSPAGTHGKANDKSVQEEQEKGDNPRQDKQEDIPQTEEEQLQDSVLSTLQDLVSSSSSEEVFHLFDINNDGRVDLDEFEGSMRTALGVINPKDPRMEIVRGIAVELCQRRRSCGLRRFKKFFGFEESAEEVEAKGCVARLIKYLETHPFSSDQSPILLWKSDEDLRVQALGNIQYFHNAFAAVKTSEMAQFERILEVFVRIDRDILEETFANTMTVGLFAKCIIDLVGVKENQRFVERLTARFGLPTDADTIFNGSERLNDILISKGQATEDALNVAHDKLLQLVVDIIQGDKTSEYKSASQKLFECIDLDGDGHLDAYEFAESMKRLGIHDSSVVAQLFNFLDKDGDGRASVEEFVEHVDNYIFRKKETLHLVLESLRGNKSPTQGVGREGFNGIPRCLQELEDKVSELRELGNNKADRECDATRVVCIRKKAGNKWEMRRRPIILVNWVAVVPDPGTGGFIERSVTGYDPTMEALHLKNDVLLLGRDPIRAIWSCHDEYLLPRKELMLLQQLRVKLDTLEVIEDNAARKIQRLFSGNIAKKQAMIVVRSRRQERKTHNDREYAATKVQSIARTRLAKKQKQKRLTVRARKDAQLRKEQRASIVIQTGVRGYIVRNKVMDRREHRRQSAAVKLQSKSRGFLIRSAGVRSQRQAYDSITAAVATPFRKGVVSRISVDVPRLSRTKVRFNVFISPSAEKGTRIPTLGKGVHPFYALETSPNGLEDKCIDVKYQRLVDLLKCYGISNVETELGVKTFKNARSQVSFEDALKKGLDADDDKLTAKLAKEIGVGVNQIYPIHKVKIVEEACLEIFLSTSGGNAGFKSFRYLQSTKTQSYCWLQIEAQSSNKIRSKPLELSTFENSMDTLDVSMKKVGVLALIASELDFYSFSQALFSRALTVEKVEGDLATLTTAWTEGCMKFQIVARLTFAKKKQTTVHNPAIPTRPLCRKAVIESVLCIYNNPANSDDSKVVNVEFF
mmetsp:Transcript_15120/g.26580  ORF Transcript_15120/g.26580 Transcript_15120/m.26580 type:complete len:4094 (+) Transcript_15120:248-12529(+)